MLPSYPPSLLFSQGLNLALGRIIKPELLEPLHGKLVSIRVIDVGISLFFTIDKTGFVACQGDKTPDLEISATAYDFILLGTRREDPDTLFFSRRLVVEGETELGLLAKNTLDACDYLWKMHQTGHLELNFRPVNATVGYHMPCHLRALNVGSPGENLLRLIPGLSLKRIEKVPHTAISSLNGIGLA